MEWMLFILLRDNLSSGFEKPSLKERIIQVNQKNKLEETNVENLKGMINEFKVIQYYVEETKQAKGNRNRYYDGYDKVRQETLQLLNTEKMGFCH